MNQSRSFASDNWAGAHPDILKAIEKANIGHAPAYGYDEYTERAVEKFKEHFGSEIEVFFVHNGTGANVLGLSTLAKTYHSVICHELAHINVDECGAAECYIGCKLVCASSPNGKLSVDLIQPLLQGRGSEHHSQPKIVSVTQATEKGTVYTQEELKAIADFAHANHLLVHMDGARISNAAATLDLPLRALTVDVGIDVLSFGGTKNGLLGGEAVVFFNKELGAEFKYIRKQGLHLPSKMRFISAQFEALLSNDLWLHNARHANRMAQILAGQLKQFDWIQITNQIESNAVFAILPKAMIPVLQKEFFFWEWDHERGEVRLMTSFDTTKEDIAQFIRVLETTDDL